MQRFDPLQVPNRAVPLDRLPVAGQARRGAVAMEVGRSQPTGMAFDHDDVEGLGGVFDLGAAMKTMIWRRDENNDRRLEIGRGVYYKLVFI